MGFPRQESWSGLPYPSPGDFPNPGIDPGSLALQADSLPSEPLGKPLMYTFIQQPMNSSYSTGLKPNLFSPPTLLPTSVIGTTLPCARMRAHTHTHTHTLHARVCTHTPPMRDAGSVTLTPATPELLSPALTGPSPGITKLVEPEITKRSGQNTCN